MILQKDKSLTEVTIGSRTYKIDDPKIAYDVDGKRYNIKDLLRPIVCKIPDTTNKTIFSNEFINSTNVFWTSQPNKYPIGVFEGGNHAQCSLEALEIAGFIECIKDGCFYCTEREMERHSSQKEYRKFSNNKHKKYYGYRNSATPEVKKELVKYGMLSPTNLISEGKKYTFGVEIETATGFLPEYLSEEMNLSCMRDGSITGGEYVTGVLTGDKGFEHLQFICNELAKRCTVDKRTGLHVHIGGFDRDNSFIVYTYKLGMIIQDELFNLLPKSRRSNNYCRKMDNLGLKTLNRTSETYKFDLDTQYEKIFEYIAYNRAKHGPEYNKHSQHPMGAKCGYDHATPRYCWLNLVPTIFDTRGDESWTMETRNHAGTLNFIKIKNWVLFCMAFVNFVENHKDEINKGYVVYKNGDEDKICVNSILKLCYPKKYQKLVDYFDKRYKTFNSDNPDQAEANEYRKVSSKNIKKIPTKDLI